MPQLNRPDDDSDDLPALGLSEDAFDESIRRRGPPLTPEQRRAVRKKYRDAKQAERPLESRVNRAGLAIVSGAVAMIASCLPARRPGRPSPPQGYPRPFDLFRRVVMTVAGIRDAIVRDARMASALSLH